MVITLVAFVLLNCVFSAYGMPGRSRIVRAADDRRITGRYIIRIDPQASSASIATLIDQLTNDDADLDRPDLSANV